MRAVLFLALIVMLIPGVLAVGIGFPEGLVDGQEFDIGDEEEYTFLLRGDSVEHDIRFFVIPNQTGVITFNGVAEYERNFNLGVYEDVPVTIEFDPIGVGVVEVTWGFRYLGSNSNSSDLSMDQVVSSFIVLEVDGYVPEEYVPIEFVDPTVGGSGGGGGAYIPPNESVAVVDSGVGVDVELADVSTQGSSTSEIVVDAPVLLSNRPERSVLFGDEGASSVNTGSTGSGKGSLLLVGFLFVLTAGLSFISYRAAKGDEDG